MAGAQLSKVLAHQIRHATTFFRSSLQNRPVRDLEEVRKRSERGQKEVCVYSSDVWWEDLEMTSRGRLHFPAHPFHR